MFLSLVCFPSDNRCYNHKYPYGYKNQPLIMQFFIGTAKKSLCGWLVCMGVTKTMVNIHILTLAKFTWIAMPFNEGQRERERESFYYSEGLYYFLEPLRTNGWNNKISFSSSNELCSWGPTIDSGIKTSDVGISLFQSEYEHKVFSTTHQLSNAMHEILNSARVYIHIYSFIMPNLVFSFIRTLMPL